MPVVAKRHTTGGAASWFQALLTVLTKKKLEQYVLAIMLEMALGF